MMDMMAWLKNFLKTVKLTKLNLILAILIVSLLFLVVRLNMQNSEQRQLYMREISSLESKYSRISDELSDMSDELLELKNKRFLEEKENQKNKIIEMVKATIDSETGKTYGAAVQKTIEDGNKKNMQYKWNVDYVSEFDTYRVSFVDTVEERGKFWEVDLAKNTVRSITSSWQLRRKYGLTPLKMDNMFPVEEIEKEELFVHNDYYNAGIVYRVTFKVKNNSGKDIADCTFYSQLVVDYSEQKTIEAESNTVSYSTISVKNPWISGRSKTVTLETKPYDITLRNYNPIDAFVYIYIVATDPLGFEYSGAIKEQNVKKLFENLDG
jgi:hypothetical protein